MAKTTFYVQVEPTYASWNPEMLRSIRAVNLTQKRPERSKGRSGTVVVKLTLDIADAAFKPLMPEAVITVPDHLVEILPLKVEAVDVPTREINATCPHPETFIWAGTTLCTTCWDPPNYVGQHELAREGELSQESS